MTSWNTLVWSRTEAATRGVLLKKVFLKILQNSQENNCARASFLINLQAGWGLVFSWHRCFPVNFTKFLGTTFLQSIFGRLLLARNIFYWKTWEVKSRKTSIIMKSGQFVSHCKRQGWKNLACVCVVHQHPFERYEISCTRSIRPEVFCKKGFCRPATLLNKRLWHRCFPVNFAKFPRTPFLTEHLLWLLLVH